MKKVWYVGRYVILGVTLGALVISQAAFAQETEGEAAATALETETVQTNGIEPLGSGLVPEEIEDAEFAADFDASDIDLDEEGNPVARIDVYDKELFDMVLISMLEEGDTILLGGEEVTVESLERDEDGSVIINGGWDAENGHVLCTDEDTVYYEVKENGAFVYALVGEGIFDIDETFIFTDDSDPENPGMEYTLEDFLNEVRTDLQEMHFSPEDTTVTVENGRITGITKTYVEEETLDPEDEEETLSTELESEK